MKEIVNLLRLDFICIRKKTLIPMLGGMIVFALFGFFLAPEFMLSVIIFSGLFPYAMFTISAKNNFNKLYGMLPVRRSSIVYARFILGALSIGVVSAVMIPISYAAQLAGIYNEELVVMGNYGLSLIDQGTTCFVIICLFTAIQFSMVFIFGIERELLVSIISTVIFILLIVLSVALGTDAVDKIIEVMGNLHDSNKPLFYIITYVSGLFAMFIFAMITGAVMKKREL